MENLFGVRFWSFSLAFWFQHFLYLVHILCWLNYFRMACMVGKRGTVDSWVGAQSVTVLHLERLEAT